MIRIRFLALAAAALSFACASVRNQAPDPESRTTLKVENDAYLDMTIYVMRGAERVRLGLATGARISTFVIPADVLRTYTPLKFIADPVGGSRVSISEEITVRPGDEVILRIPPA